MKHFSLIIVFSALFCTHLFAANNNAFSDEQIYEKVDSLLSIMTLEEKAGQMLNLGLGALLEGDFFAARDTLIFDTAKVRRLIVKFGAGSVQNYAGFPLSPKYWRRMIGYIQKVALEETRLGIPILYGMDAVHGANYNEASVMLPQQIGLAATFNKQYAFDAGRITAYEMKAAAQPWNFSPVLDVARHPNWGRMAESFGEDPYLVTVLGTAMLRGMQGEDPSDPEHVLASGKHFLGYGAPLFGRDRSSVLLPEYYMRQYLLPPFEKAIENGLLSIMIYSGTINGIPSHADKWLLTDLLKNELGFKGILISDWGDVDNLHLNHKVAQNERDAVKKSVLAGLDISMEPYNESFAVHLVDLVKDGEVPVSRIDDAVRRILYVKFKAGVFRTPYFDELVYDKYSSKESHELNLEIAQESITLLKNENENLPLNRNQKVLVTGVAANSLNYLNGAWSRTWAGEDTTYNDIEKNTILEAIRAEIGPENVLYAAGTAYEEELNISQATTLAKEADAIIICIGEKPATEFFSDINELEIPKAQQKLITELATVGKPITLVMVQGRPRIINNIEPLAKSVIMAYLPGNEGGPAIADILFGDVNPSGKLPYTYPRHTGVIMPYDAYNLFGLRGVSPQYEFGFGLSYTTFEYSNIQLSNTNITFSDTLTISVDIENTGKIEGKEVAMLYLSDEVSSMATFSKLLKRFEKINLKPGEKKTVKFNLTIEDLTFMDQKNTRVAEPGVFIITIGDQSIKFHLKE